VSPIPLPAVEQPEQCGPALFVLLKGPTRGARMTPAGMRSLFRYHRYVSDRMAIMVF
jgi:hypothetical protein